MREAEFLFTVAEVGTAFAGFATLVVVIRQRFGDSQSAGQVRLASMLRLAILAVLFSLAPYLPFHIGLPAELVWRICSALLGTAWLLYYVSLVRALFPVPNTSFTNVNRFFLWCVHPVMLALLLAGTAGVLGDRVSTAYLSAVLVLLGLSSALFVQIVAALAQD